MPGIIRNYDNQNKAIIDGKNSILSLIYFNLLKLKKGEKIEVQIEGFETVFVALSGTCDIDVNGEKFLNVGQRPDIWSGKPDSVYATTGAKVVVTSHTDNLEVAVAGGRCSEKYPPFRVTSDEVEIVDVGSRETNCHRRIFHILGQNVQGRVGNLLVNELRCDDGNWSGYPPHKHDEELGEEETAFEEVYHYRFRPENGFGAQIIFQKDGSSQAYMTKNGDTILIDKGYHPTVTSPGHEEYVFTILVGKYQRSLVQNFKEEYRYLNEKIPGIGDMIDKYRAK